MARTMTHATRHASTGLAALAVLSLGHWARANGVFASPVATFILGVLPNVAAAVAIPSITAGALADRRKDRQVPIDLRTFTMLNLGSVAGLVAWEFVQQGACRFDSTRPIWWRLSSAPWWRSGRSGGSRRSSKGDRPAEVRAGLLPRL